MNLLPALKNISILFVSSCALMKDEKGVSFTILQPRMSEKGRKKKVIHLKIVCISQKLNINYINIYLYCN